MWQCRELLIMDGILPRVIVTDTTGILTKEGIDILTLSLAAMQIITVEELFIKNLNLLYSCCNFATLLQRLWITTLLDEGYNSTTFKDITVLEKKQLYVTQVSLMPLVELL